MSYFHPRPAARRAAAAIVQLLPRPDSLQLITDRVVRYATKLATEIFGPDELPQSIQNSIANDAQRLAGKIVARRAEGQALRPRIAKSLDANAGWAQILCCFELEDRAQHRNRSTAAKLREARKRTARRTRARASR